MAWVILIVAGLIEVVWALGLKYSNGFTRLLPSVITVVGMALSVYLLSLSAKTLPTGNAFAVWTGIGAVGTVILGNFLRGEPRSLTRLFFVALIAADIIGLRFTGGE